MSFLSTSSLTSPSSSVRDTELGLQKSSSETRNKEIPAPIPTEKFKILEYWWISHSCTRTIFFGHLISHGLSCRLILRSNTHPQSRYRIEGKATKKEKLVKSSSIHLHKKLFSHSYHIWKVKIASSSLQEHVNDHVCYILMVIKRPIATQARHDKKDSNFYMYTKNNVYPYPSICVNVLKRSLAAWI